MLPEFTKIVKDNVTTFEKVKYDMDKPASEQSHEARNNLLIDMMWGILTNPDTTAKVLNPGGFDYQKKAARITDALKLIEEKELLKILQVTSIEEAIDKLFNMDVDELSEILDNAKINPLSPITQITLHENIMNGAKLIGIYANHNANHAIMQHTNLQLSEDAAFTFNGKVKRSLHDMQNDLMEFISRNNAGFLAASVDNAKDPNLASMNQNTFTADVTMLLSRLGYNPIEISILLNQPIILEITRRYLKENRNGTNADTIIEEVLKKYKQKASIMTEDSYDNYKNQNFLVKDLAKNIVIEKRMRDMQYSSQTNDEDNIYYYKRQLAVGYLFAKMMKSADALKRLVQVTRADTQNGACGPTIADTIIKVQKIEDFLRDKDSEGFPLVNVDMVSDYTPDTNNTSVDDIRKQLLSSRLPYMQAFTTLGLLETKQMLSKYFPHYNSQMQNVIDGLRFLTKSERLNVKTMNSIYNDYFAYVASGLDFFGSDNSSSAKEKREKFINNFPDYFQKTVKNNPDIAELEFIKRLKYIRANQNNPVDTIVFKNVGSLSNRLREVYQRDWASLLYMKNPEAQKLALNLFLYSYYRSGFAFGPASFIHLAPVIVRKAIPQYTDWLYGMLEDSQSEEADQNFITMYIRNHLDNRALVPEIKEGTSVNFFNEKKEPVDSFEITITKTSTPKDKQFVRRSQIIQGEYIVSPLEYIAVRYKNDFVYYALDWEHSSGDNHFTYKQVSPLGYKNSFIEYDVYDDAQTMESVIHKKERKGRELPNPEEYNSYETPEMTQEDSEYLNDGDDIESLHQSYGYLGNQTIEESPDEVSSNRFTNIEPNENWKDGNNEPICRL